MLPAVNSSNYTGAVQSLVTDGKGVLLCRNVLYMHFMPAGNVACMSYGAIFVPQHEMMISLVVLK